MKQLTCEMCGSTDLMKDGGVFVCQSCGCKYSIEEAKKMMVEGTVKVAGTVKVDRSDQIKNYLSIAKKAYDADNQKEAEEYCNRILEVDDKNYEAWLLKGKAAGWQSTIANLRIGEAINCFSNAVENAPENKSEGVKKTVSEETTKLCLALMRLCCGNFGKTGYKEQATTILSCLVEVKRSALALLIKCGTSTDDINAQLATMINNSAMDAWNDHIGPDFWGEDHPMKYSWEKYIERGDCVLILLEIAIGLDDGDVEADVVRYKNLIGVQDKLINSWSWTLSSGSWVHDYTLTPAAKQGRTDKIMEWHEAIKKIDPTYTIPERPAPQSGGCYVATAVYGSYDCPQVWTLRRYRDYTLAETRRGRAFIKAYYAISPTLVRWFGDTHWFKAMWRGKLDRMVKNLQAEGVESTPYNDRVWK